MATRMLIDARHPEETRVAVLKGNRIEEFDFESAEHKQIKGNIYLAKVTRVEPSLQAAFVDFGGNRHGFLAFSEIHPDYYQIPQSDREALLAEEQAHADEEAALRAAEDESDGDGFDDSDDEDDEEGVEEIDTSEKDDVAIIEDGQVEGGDDGETDDNDDSDSDESDGDESDDESSEDDSEESGEENDGDNRRGRGRGRNRRQGGGRNGNNRGGNRGGNSGGRAKEIDDLRAKRQALRRRYKIQDVIQRRQVLLVQVVKEERGNKGAALTSYLSLAGRYCVLMPNSSSGGGISRKIANGSDRKRLKQIVSDLTLPKSMGLIVRTAGLQRTKTEIKRDFDYLARLWDEIRERTMASSAPAVIHSDSDLIKRAIRDIYNREIEEVVVEGEGGHKAAREFMKLLMPSHVRKVKSYVDPVPLFQRFGAEDQLTAMYEPVVQLKSGGYLVINPTEALVSIDINSGRSTKEHGIEQTATATNLEAAREIARQLRLRDMAGLVVIDFIDMENNSNTRKVERAMKDALSGDRARIQVGRISGFGLMEMSRQRLRTGVLEATTRTCPHCDGTGLVRTASSAGLSALRMIEDESAKGKGTKITLFASTEAAVYLLNAKRSDLAEIEALYGVSVDVVPEGEDEGAKMRVQSSGPRPTEAPKFAPLNEVIEEDDFDVDEEEEEEEEAADGGRNHSSRDQGEREDGDQKRKPRRRRGGRGRNRNRTDDDSQARNGAEDQSGDSQAAADDGQSQHVDDSAQSEDGTSERKPRRRRGGRRRNKNAGEAGQPADAAGNEGEVSTDSEAEVEAASADADAGTKPKPRTRRKKAVTEDAPVSAETVPEAEAEAVTKPKPRIRRKKVEESATENTAENSVENGPEAAPADEPKPKPRTRRKKAEPAATAAEEAGTEVEAAAPPPKPRRKPAARAKKQEVAEASTNEAPSAQTPAVRTSAAESSEDHQESADGTRKGGWWQRTFGA